MKKKTAPKLFDGASGRADLIRLLQEQKTVQGNVALAEKLADFVVPQNVKDGQILIHEGERDSDLYFILDGAIEFSIKGKKQGHRGGGNTIGEMAAIQSAQPRSATVRAAGDALVAALSSADLEKIANEYPSMWQQFARELARRLMERNRSIATAREKIRVFIISSREAIDIVRTIENDFERDTDIEIVAWKNDVFKVANYPLEDLEVQLDLADFAVAIAHADDVVTSRRKRSGAPRDNVVFELAYFMGRLGRRRSVLIEPAVKKVKLPSDFTGVTNISYTFDKADAAKSMAVPCNKLRS